jgi:hypothetical protein
MKLSNEEQFALSKLIENEVGKGILKNSMVTTCLYQDLYNLSIMSQDNYVINYTKFVDYVIKFLDEKLYMSGNRHP